MVVTKYFNKDFFSKGGALTLDHNDIGTNNSGWTITGKINKDHFIWVNNFSATHPTLGFVKGDFEDEVTASSEEAFKHFYEHHTPMAWDYMDI